MSLYDELAAETQAILKELGQVGQIIKTVNGSTDPADTTPSNTDAAPVDARMAVFPVDTKKIDGTNIKAGDYQVIIEPLSIEIEADDKLTCSEGTLRVIHPGKNAPAGTTVVYEAICRG